MKAWDKVLAPLLAVSVSFPLVIVAGLDHRFKWSPAFPIWLNILGFVLIAMGYAFAGWALAENRFFSSVVRIQTERGHVVCDSGPYRFVRHPGYAGNILALPGIVTGFRLGVDAHSGGGGSDHRRDQNRTGRPDSTTRAAWLSGLYTGAYATGCFRGFTSTL